MATEDRAALASGWSPWARPPRSSPAGTAPSRWTTSSTGAATCGSACRGTPSRRRTARAARTRRRSRRAWRQGCPSPDAARAGRRRGGRRGRARPGEPRRRRGPGARAARPARPRLPPLASVAPELVFSRPPVPLLTVATIRKPITGKQGRKHGGWNRAGEGEHLAPGREVRDRTGKAVLRHLGSWRAASATRSTGGRKPARAGSRPGGGSPRSRCPSTIAPVRSRRAPGSSWPRMTVPAALRPRRRADPPGSRCRRGTARAWACCSGCGLFPSYVGTQSLPRRATRWCRTCAT